jgi:hypothetical protein
MKLRIMIIFAALFWSKCSLAQSLEGWWIVLAAYPDNPPERMSDDVRAVERQARPCSTKTFSDFSGKFLGFAPGHVVFVQAGPPFKAKNAADVELHRVRGCFPDAYLKRARYLGE